METAAGEIVLSTSVARDGALMALSADGHTLWNRRFELEGWQYASEIEAVDGGYLLAGFSMAGNGAGAHADVWMAEASRDGDLLWEKSFGEPEADDYATGLIRLSDGNYLVAGLGRGLPLWKVDASGTVLWERRIDDPGVFAAQGAIELEDGGFLAWGEKAVIPARSYDAVLLRTEPDRDP